MLDHLFVSAVSRCDLNDTAPKMKFSIKDFFSKCDQLRSFLEIWSHLLKKPLMENFIFCVVWQNISNVITKRDDLVKLCNVPYFGKEKKQIMPKVEIF